MKPFADRECALCGKKFTPRCGSQKYCERACTVKAHDERNHGKSTGCTHRPTPLHLPGPAKLPAGQKWFEIACDSCKKLRMVSRHAALAFMNKPNFCRSCSRKSIRASMKFQPRPCSTCGREFTPASGGAAKCPQCKKPSKVHECPVCGQRYVGQANKKTCSPTCSRRLRTNESYFGGKLFDAAGWKDKTCQICGRIVTKKGHVHHILSHPNHDHLAYLCAGCHDEVSKLAMRTQWGQRQFERLIWYALAQKTKSPSRIVRVEIEELSDEEFESWNEFLEAF